MKKIGFPLTVEEGWPPFEVEHIWVDMQGDKFRIRNLPFFVKGIAFDDLISAELDENNYVLRWELVSPSTNSTMWIIENEPTDILDKLRLLGCGAEIGNPAKLISVNIPPSTDLASLDAILTQYEDCGAIAVAVPADRIGLLS